MPTASASLPIAQRILAGVAREIGEAQATRYFAGVSIGCEGDLLTVVVGTRFLADLLDRRFGDLLRRIARHELGESAPPAQFRVDPARHPAPMAPAADGADAGAAPTATTQPLPADQPARHRTPSGARARPWKALTLRRFEDFVVGHGSSLAFTQAVALAEAAPDEPAHALFLHSECGMGKTHLLQAIVARHQERRPDARVRWTTGEAFTNAYITAVQANAVDAFRRAHRDLDLLCIDDVHFLSNKVATQNELLHTFDALGHAGARVALASDAHPRHIARLSEGLVSRFLAGMVVRIDPPDAATRAEIVRRFCLRRGLAVDAPVAAAVVERAPGSVRDLEGAVIKLEAVHRMLTPGETSGRITLGTLDRALGTASSPRPVRRPIAVLDIARLAGETLHVELDDLLGRSRHQRVVLARSITALLARDLTTQSFPEIAREMNRPNHSSIITAQQRMAEQVRADLPLDTPSGPIGAKALYDTLRASLLSGARPV